MVTLDLGAGKALAHGSVVLTVCTRERGIMCVITVIHVIHGSNTKVCFGKVTWDGGTFRLRRKHSI